MFFKIIIAVLCVFVSFVLYHWNRNYRIKKKLLWLPTVPGWPIIGNVLEFGDLNDLLGNLTRLLNRKEKVVLLDVLTAPVIFVADYDFIEFLLSSQQILSKSQDYHSFYENWLGTGLLLSSGSKWKTRRRILSPSFHFSILEDFLQVFESSGETLVKKLKTMVDKDGIKINKYITLHTLDIINEAAMGVKINAQEGENSEYVRNVELMCTVGMTRAISITKNYDCLYPLTPDYYREQKAVKQLHSVTTEIIKKRIEISKNSEKDDEVDEYGRRKRKAFLDLLLRTKVDGKPLSLEDLREEVDTFMFAGHDTTAVALSFCIYWLSNNPDVQNKALEEQKDIFGDDRFRSPTIAELNNMKYLECVIKESLRMCPSVPLIGRHVDEDIYYKGNLLPKGTELIICTYNYHHDSDYWTDPEKFDPSRFEAFDGKKPYVFIPFSAGPRNCIGQKFAMLEMKSTLSKLLRHFEILPTVPKHELILAAETVLKSATGIKIRLKERLNW